MVQPRRPRKLTADRGSLWRAVHCRAAASRGDALTLAAEHGGAEGADQLHDVGRRQVHGRLQALGRQLDCRGGADEPALPQPSDDELELERDMEYFVEPEETLGTRGDTEV